ncbi:hypothetical protein [Nonomuraea sp. SBT364]|uniref:hypothetical protein n=1 Tax=Nonomuraea sp. SBT364 TaxID=1580530 RepID=UPI0012E2A99E|nr:hypothetical protein [Nonomuraea sp. SBT364]
MRRRGLAGNELGADAMPPKSFYDLAFGVSPGGARKDAHCIRGSIDEINADLA